MGARILVIEDNPDNMELMRYVLQAFGYEVSTAIDGERGLESVRNERPDLIACDLQLPGIDGFEVARQLKADPAYEHIPLIAVTAYAMVDDRDRVLGAGFDGYISKPIDPRSLVPQISAFLGMPAPEPVPHDTPEAQDSAPIPLAYAQALVLDDVAENLEFLRSLLEPNGIGVEAASTIAEAYARLSQHTPDIIISDLHLSGERGEDFYAWVKAQAELRPVPFVFISSTSRRDADRLAALSAGADRFITRPMDSARLLAEIEACLSLRKGP